MRALPVRDHDAQPPQQLPFWAFPPLRKPHLRSLVRLKFHQNARVRNQHKLCPSLNQKNITQDTTASDFFEEEYLITSICCSSRAKFFLKTADWHNLVKTVSKLERGGANLRTNPSARLCPNHPQLQRCKATSHCCEQLLNNRLVYLFSTYHLFSKFETLVFSCNHKSLSPMDQQNLVDEEL